MAPISIDGGDVSDITIDGDTVSEVTMDGDVVWTATTVVEDWEDANLNDWTESAAGNWTFPSSGPSAYSGSEKIRAETSSGTIELFSGSGDGLPVYPSIGDGVNYRMYMTASNSRFEFYFGVGTDHPVVTVNPDEVEVREDTNNLVSDSVSVPIGEWVHVDTDTTEENATDFSITATVYNASGSEITTLTLTGVSKSNFESGYRLQTDAGGAVYMDLLRHTQ